jgi:MFS family permease
VILQSWQLHQKRRTILEPTMSRVIVQEGIDLQVLNIASSTLNEQPDGAKSVAEPSAPGRVLGSRPESVNDGIPRHAAGPLLDSVESFIALSSTRISMVILQLTAVSFLGSFAHGIVVVGLPAIASALDLSRELYLWPVSVYGLTSGSVLLIAGSVADLIGPRRVELAGLLLLAVFTLTCGFAATGLQLVILRALAGIAIAMHMPASVAIVAQILPNGRARNVGFACLGLSQPLGFSFGLVLSGVMIGRLGWRAGFYIAGGVMLMVAVLAFWVLPRLHGVRDERRGLAFVLKRIATEVDWIGCLLASGGLASLAYVLAMVGAELVSIRSGKTATLLAIGTTLLASFPFWEQRQTKAGRPALIPNSMWSKLPFTTTCVMILLSWGALNGMELFSTL